MTSMKSPHLTRLLESVKTGLSKLSSRERVLLAVPLFFACIFVIHGAIIQPIHETFDALEEERAKVDTQVTDFGRLLQEYGRLKARRAHIEEEYKEIVIKDSARAVLENLIKTKLGVTSPRDFNLNNPRSEPFGGGYEKTSVNVEVRNISDMGKLVSFLQEVVYGPNPFILKHLNLDKGVSDRFLKIDFEASSIGKK